MAYFPVETITSLINAVISAALAIFIVIMLLRVFAKMLKPAITEAVGE